jgi:predicted patatin/cPLA2 family phospholipase
MKTRDEHLFGPGPKRILSLDGGGVRGLISLGILARVEALLRERVPEGQRDAFRLCDYFDLIGGTSTGALIAVQLAMGESVAEITERYKKLCPKLFGSKRWFPIVRTWHSTKRFDQELQNTFAEILNKHPLGFDQTLASPILKTGLAVIAKRIDTGSVWFQSNNWKRKFWDPSKGPWKPFWDEERAEKKFVPNPNAEFKILDIVRASASAPIYFDPLNIRIDQNTVGRFIDGGASPFNDPSSELFLAATLQRRYEQSQGEVRLSPFGFSWSTGRDNLFLFSVGAGDYRNRNEKPRRRDILKVWRLFGLGRGRWGGYRFLSSAQAVEALVGIIADGQKNTRVWMQAISVPPREDKVITDQHSIDGKVGAMEGLRIVDQPLLTYRRANVKLETEWLEDFGFKVDERDRNRLRELDCRHEYIHDLLFSLGDEVGRRFVNDDDFRPVFDLDGWLHPDFDLFKQSRSLSGRAS